MCKFANMQICKCFMLMLCFFSGSVSGQSLLVNGSFEEENICVEYNKNCAPEGWISTTLTSDYYFERSGLGRSGYRFAGIIAGNTRTKFKRSYLRTRLLCGLRRGNLYRLDFFVRSRHNAFDSIGVYFSPTDPLAEKKVFTQLTPAFINRDTAVTALSDSLQWKKISFVYTANGTEAFLTIGSFKKAAYQFSRPPDMMGNYYAYIDDVSLVALDDHEKLCAAADSMKHEIYNENERHELLVRKAKLYRSYPPQAEKPQPTIILKIDTLIIPDILFATGSARLNEASVHVLDSFSNAMGLKPFDSLIVAGHTDSVGTLVYNTKLSADRAKAVAEYITQKVQVARRKLQVRYHAYLHPVASNRTPEGRQRNRRVEIFLYRHE
jgi:outer membrane protein OmpA-like peptidoglycan-associated protein